MPFGHRSDRVTNLYKKEVGAFPDAILNLTWKYATERGSLKAKAVVTKRIKPLMCDGKAVHVVGIPQHWGFMGLRALAPGQVLGAYLDSSPGSPTRRHRSRLRRRRPA